MIILIAFEVSIRIYLIRWGFTPVKGVQWFELWEVDFFWLFGWTVLFGPLWNGGNVFYLRYPFEMMHSFFICYRGYGFSKRAVWNFGKYYFNVDSVLGNSYPSDAALNHSQFCIGFWMVDHRWSVWVSSIRIFSYFLFANAFFLLRVAVPLIYICYFSL